MHSSIKKGFNVEKDKKNKKIQFNECSLKPINTEPNLFIECEQLNYYNFDRDIDIEHARLKPDYKSNFKSMKRSQSQKAVLNLLEVYERLLSSCFRGIKTSRKHSGFSINIISTKTILQSREYTSKFDDFNSKIKDHKRELLAKMKSVNRSTSNKTFSNFKLEDQLEIREIGKQSGSKTENYYQYLGHKYSDNSSHKDAQKTEDTTKINFNSNIYSKTNNSNKTFVNNNQILASGEVRPSLQKNFKFNTPQKNVLMDFTFKNDNQANFKLVQPYSFTKQTEAPCKIFDNSGVSKSIIEQEQFKISHSKHKSNPECSKIYSNVSSNDIFDICVIEGQTPEMTESNLRIFYNENKSKFTERIKKGPPNCFRWISWMIILNVPEKRNDSLYKSNYLPYLKDEVELQIKKDLNRTIPEYIVSEFNEKEIADKEFVLYRLLKSFAINDPEVSYCQGMNYIASFLLMTSDYNENEAFYVLLSLFSKTFHQNLGIRGFYTQGFHLLNFYVSVFNHFFASYNSKLYKHMIVELELNADLWVSKWFMTLFTICLPFEVISRVWDCLFSTDLEFIIKFTLSFLKNIEPTLMSFTDTFDILDFFKNLSPFENSDIILGGAFKYNIESILTEALKIKLSSDVIHRLKRQYETKHKVDLKLLDASYDLTKAIETTSDDLNNFSDSGNYSKGEPTPVTISKNLISFNRFKSTIMSHKKDGLEYDLNSLDDNPNDIEDPEVDSEMGDDIGSKLNLYKFKLSKH